MAKYYYEKWTVEKVYKTRTISTGSGPMNSASGYTNVKFNYESEIFEDFGTFETIYPTAQENIRSLLLYSVTGKSYMSYQFKGSILYTIEEVFDGYVQIKGNYIETIVAEEGIYPDDGLYHDGSQVNYWYVKKGKAGLNLYPRIDGQVKQVTEAKVRINGQLKDILGVWIRVDGKLREV